jgi:hypothetical protein
MVTGALVQTRQHGVPAAREVGDQPGAFDLDSHDIAATGVLSDFLRRSQPWNRQPVPLPRRLRRTLWALVPIELVWGIWLWTITTGASPCDGPLCTVATLNHHAAVLLGCAIVSAAGLLALAAATRGLSQCGDREVVGVGIAAGAGGAALLGIAALLVGAAIALIILMAFVAAFTASA